MPSLLWSGAETDEVRAAEFSSASATYSQSRTEKLLVESVLELKGLVPRSEGVLVNEGVEHGLLLMLISDTSAFVLDVEPSFWSTYTMNDFIALDQVFNDFPVDGSSI
jgi:hypothetical protein